MSEETSLPSRPRIALVGELTCRPAPFALRLLFIVTGLLLVMGLLRLLGRLALGWRRTATLGYEAGTLTIDHEWRLLGRQVRAGRVVSPIQHVNAARLENRQRAAQLLVGVGGLAVGTFVGLQWLVDGLRAGFPYLMLVGAGFVALGVALDLVLGRVLPIGPGRDHLDLVLGPWRYRLSGVDGTSAAAVVDAIRRDWQQARPGR